MILWNNDEWYVIYNVSFGRYVSSIDRTSGIFIINSREHATKFLNEFEARNFIKQSIPDWLIHQYIVVDERIDNVMNT